MDFQDPGPLERKSRLYIRRNLGAAAATCTQRRVQLGSAVMSQLPKPLWTCLCHRGLGLLVISEPCLGFPKREARGGWEGDPGSKATKGARLMPPPHESSERPYQATSRTASAALSTANQSEAEWSTVASGSRTHALTVRDVLFVQINPFFIWRCHKNGCGSV